MSLAAWQARLQSHFEGLRQQRPPDTPIFGLEHGLDPSDLDELEDAVRNHIAQSRPSIAHSLAWVVYASEFGYRYAGDEYWQTFEQCTPGWETRGDRYWIRRCFRDFCDRFGGARPSGPWADHFSIICWPITHAILPRDLQRHLARILYDLRDAFTAEIIGSAYQLGQHIAAASWNASSRFQDFAQQPILVGQIATALLFQDQQLAGTLILPSTLQRIATDLDQERAARTWLKTARGAAGQLQFWGLRGRGGPATGPRVDGYEWGEQVKRTPIEPRLVLRPASDSSWTALLETPDLTPLLLRFPHLRDALTGSRCTVAGSTRSPLARGRVLYGTQRVVLEVWPNPDEVLLRFEHAPPELEYLLKTECLLRPGPTWLFRIQTDGCAYEVRSKVVRPGESYILLSSAGPIQACELGAAASVECQRVYAARLDLPVTVSGPWQELIETLGLQQARSLRVWPVGLPAADWDGEGRGEWLVSDRPRIGIRVDHAVDSILLSLDGAEPQGIEVESADSDATAFVELPDLLPGSHTLSVTIRPAQAELGDESGQLDLIIREPRTWAPARSRQSPLVVVVDPPVPSLEQLWEGAVRIDIHGPVGHSIACSSSLFEKSADLPFVRKALPCMELPVDTASWTRHFQEHLRENPEVQSAYDRAQACQIDFDGAELGAFSLRCEREFTPLRWIAQRKGTRYTLTLMDDTGSDTSVQVARYAFGAPDTPIPVDLSTVSYPLEVPDVSGLYVARVDQHHSGVVIPPQVRNLDVLCADAQLQDIARSSDAIEKALVPLEHWSDARIPGDALALTLRQRVVKALLQHIFAVICGEQWDRAERATRPENSAELPESLELLARAISAEPQDQWFVANLEWEYVDLAADTINERITRLWLLVINYLSVPSRRTVEPQHVELTGRWLTELALRLASCPESARYWSQGKLRAGLHWLLQVPVLARAVRFLVLAIDAYLQPQPLASGRLYNGWEWDPLPTTLAVDADVAVHEWSAEDSPDFLRSKLDTGKWQ